VLGAGAEQMLRALTPGGIGIDPSLTFGLGAGFEAKQRLARGIFDSSAWSGQWDLPISEWAGLKSSAEGAFGGPAGEWADRSERGAEATDPKTVGIAERLREMGMWLPIRGRQEAAFWLNFAVSVRAVKQAIASGHAGSVLFALISLMALSLTWPGGPPPGD
jgi:hypothetical protein